MMHKPSTAPACGVYGCYLVQDKAQQLVTEQVAAMAESNAHNGALVAIRPSTGEILAMVGLPEINNAGISCEINMAISATRQPG